MIKAQYDLDLSPAERLKAAGIRKAIRIGANRAAAKVKAAVVGHAERIKLRGYIAKSIRIRVKVYRGEKFVSIVGTSRAFSRSGGLVKRGRNKGKRRRIRPASYAHLVERGTKFMAAKPWLAPAHAETAAAYFADAARETGREIQNELNRRGP